MMIRAKLHRTTEDATVWCCSRKLLVSANYLSHSASTWPDLHLWSNSNPCKFFSFDTMLFTKTLRRINQQMQEFEVSYWYSCRLKHFLSNTNKCINCGDVELLLTSLWHGCERLASCGPISESNLRAIQYFCGR